MMIVDKEKLLTKEAKAKIKEIACEFEHLTKYLQLTAYSANVNHNKKGMFRYGYYHSRRMHMLTKEETSGIIFLNMTEPNGKLRDEVHLVATFAHEFGHFLQHAKVRTDFKGRFSERDAQFFEVSKINKMYNLNWKLVPEFRTYFYGSDREVKRRSKYDRIEKEESQ